MALDVIANFAAGRSSSSFNSYYSNYFNYVLSYKFLEYCEKNKTEDALNVLNKNERSKFINYNLDDGNRTTAFIYRHV